MKIRSEDVARYYDENTHAFLGRGHGGAEGAIHRAVWGEGVENRRQAFHFVHELLIGVLDEMEISTPRILDLGCGVGASLLYLLERRDAEAFGITNSDVQLRLARERASGRATFLRGDFCVDELPAPIDLAYGIESFVQAPDAGAFFERVGRALRDGGRLALCDDFLADTVESHWIEEFRRGWRASSLVSPEAADTLAAAAGLALVEDRDLTPFLELDRPRDRVIAALAPLIRTREPANERIAAYLGGDALRRCLKRGAIRYRFRVWRQRGREP